ncbi:MAG: hypothetical protein F6K24_02580 [Okeania sp. SIO2D1]|nr:hypothetical protein [Okeania sp. SIO2D1]
MGISLINLDKGKHSIDKGAYRIINVFCGIATAGGLFCLLIAPDSINPKVNKIAGVAALLGGVFSGISLVCCGWYLRDKERVISAVEKQEVELFQHQLALSRVFFEKQREQVVTAILEGGEIEENKPLPITPMTPMPIPATREVTKELPPPQAIDNSFEGRKQQLWGLIQQDAEWLVDILPGLKARGFLLSRSSSAG